MEIIAGSFGAITIKKVYGIYHGRMIVLATTHSFPEEHNPLVFIGFKRLPDSYFNIRGSIFRVYYSLKGYFLIKKLPKLIV